MKKNILITIILILSLIIVAGVYKFNYLSSLDNYDVDGNKAIEDTNDTYISSGTVEMIPFEPNNGIGDGAESLDNILNKK